MLLSARAYRVLVNGKNISVRMRDPTGEYTTQYKDELEELRLWRCKSLDFPDMYLSDKDEVLAQKLQSIVEEVCGTTPVNDIFRQWRAFMELVVKPLKDSSNSSLETPESQTMMKKLKRYALTREHEKFTKLRDELLEKFSESFIEHVTKG